MKYANREMRLLANSVQPQYSDCWEWIGRSRQGHGPTGYPAMNVRLNGRHTTLSAHRVAFEEWCGPIPEGFEIDHLCHNTMCINPAHLAAVAPAENQKHKKKSKKRLAPRRAAGYIAAPMHEAPTYAT